MWGGIPTSLLNSIILCHPPMPIEWYLFALFGPAIGKCAADHPDVIPFVVADRFATAADDFRPVRRHLIGAGNTRFVAKAQCSVADLLVFPQFAFAACAAN